MSTLYSFYEELTGFGFDKKKAKGLVKHANNAGFQIYFCYHEDGAETWKTGWSENDYKKSDTDVKLFEATTLIGKSQGGGNFKKSRTYTAECAIFIFAPLEVVMKDEFLRERQINIVRSKEKKHAVADYATAIASKIAFEKWESLPAENKAQIEKIHSELPYNFVGAAELRKQMEKQIIELGGLKPYEPKDGWQAEALSFPDAESYIAMRQQKAVKELIESIEA